MNNYCPQWIWLMFFTKASMYRRCRASISCINETLIIFDGDKQAVQIKHGEVFDDQCMEFGLCSNGQVMNLQIFQQQLAMLRLDIRHVKFWVNVVETRGGVEAFTDDYVPSSVVNK